MSGLNRKYNFLVSVIMVLVILLCLSTVFFLDCIDRKNEEIRSLEKKVDMLDEHQAAIVSEYFKMIGVGG